MRPARLHRTRAHQPRTARPRDVCLPGSCCQPPADALRKSLPAQDLVSPQAGEIWFASSVVAGLLLFGLAVFFFLFGALPYWFKVHKHLHEILGCEYLVAISLWLYVCSCFALGWALTFPNGAHSWPSYASLLWLTGE